VFQVMLCGVDFVGGTHRTFDLICARLRLDSNKRHDEQIHSVIRLSTVRFRKLLPGSVVVRCWPVGDAGIWDWVLVRIVARPGYRADILGINLTNYEQTL
jgi:hypothetical protein